MLQWEDIAIGNISSEGVNNGLPKFGIMKIDVRPGRH